jgi:hypothetical protein
VETSSDIAAELPVDAEDFAGLMDDLDVDETLFFLDGGDEPPLVATAILLFLSDNFDRVLQTPIFLPENIYI